MNTKQPLKLYTLITLVTGLVCAQASAQTCSPHTWDATTPTEDFILHADGTATHKTTGLQWSRCLGGKRWEDGKCTGTASVVSWQGALNRADSSNFAGFDDWRLPNIKELASIVEYACSQPSLNTEVFESTMGLAQYLQFSSPRNFSQVASWSASPDVSENMQAWAIRFVHNGTAHISNTEGRAMLYSTANTQTTIHSFYLVRDPD